MDFKTASDRATGACITLADIADAAGVPHQSLRRARVDPTSASYRRPPEGWEKAIAKLAEARAAELARLAAELRGAGE